MSEKIPVKEFKDLVKLQVNLKNSAVDENETNWSSILVFGDNTDLNATLEEVAKDMNIGYKMIDLDSHPDIARETELFPDEEVDGECGILLLNGINTCCDATARHTMGFVECSRNVEEFNVHILGDYKLPKKWFIVVYGRSKSTNELFSKTSVGIFRDLLIYHVD